MRFTVETWAPEYGAAVTDPEMERAAAEVDAGIETEPAAWAGRRPDPPAEVPARILFLDGVRRIDARVWITDPDPTQPSAPGICASHAAGAVCVEGDRAGLHAAVVERGVFTGSARANDIATAHATYPVRLAADDSPEGLALAVQERMLATEARLAAEADAELVVVDGPLRGPHTADTAVGYVKTHHTTYLPTELMGVVGGLEVGERSPLFLIGGRFTRLSWYVRLPGTRTHPLAGIVRCEQHAGRPVPDAVERADLVAALLPRFASEAHKDPRAPQNLYPVAGLERELRRRLGDPRVLELALRRAAVGT